jgi:hypothetical protein
MKKKFIIFAVLILMMSSCVTTFKVKTVFDESVSIEKSALLSTYQAGDIIGYNGIPVKWKLGYNQLVQIPAGDALLEWNILMYDGQTRTKGNNILTRCHFEPNKQYIIYGGYKIEDHEDPKLSYMTYGLYIYAYEASQKKIAFPYSVRDHFVAFVPFLNVNRSVLKKLS